MATAALLLLLPRSADAADTHSAHHAFHANELAAFFGTTAPYEPSHGDPTPTVGFDYERRVTMTWGISALADFVVGDHKRTSMFAVQATVRPMANLKLAAGPGWERVEKDKPDGTTKLSHHTVFTTRAGYEFHVGMAVLAPTVGVDFIGETETNFVYGLTVGHGF